VTAEQVRFLAVGDLMVDVVVAGRGHDAIARLAPGGTAANTAAWAASLGAKATAVGAIGDDAGGRLLRSELIRRGVEPLFVVDPTNPTGTFVVADGELLVDRGANATLYPSVLPPLPAADAVLISGYLPPTTLEAALAQARADWVLLDAAALPALPEGGNALVANEQQGRALTGAEPEDAVRILAERYRLACVTQGARGAVAMLDGRLERAEPAERALQEAPGAGDAFAASVLVMLARGAALRDALREGCRAGAEAARAPGWPSVRESADADERRREES
jgi:sugar/nucleoside kinase (ribokinase family)